MTPRQFPLVDVLGEEAAEFSVNVKERSDNFIRNLPKFLIR
jgi:hypothetical protein